MPIPKDEMRSFNNFLRESRIPSSRKMSDRSIVNYEKESTNGSGHSDDLYFAAGYVPNSKTEYALNFTGGDTITAGINIVKNIKNFDFKIDLENNLFDVNNNKNAKIFLSRIF